MFEELVKNIIMETFTSRDMQKYLCENVSALTKDDIVEIVRKSFIPLERKLAMFRELSKYENADEVEEEIRLARTSKNKFEEIWIKEYSFYYQMLSMEQALAELAESKEKRSIFLLHEMQIFKGNEKEIDVLPFFSYEKCCSYIKKECEQYAEEKQITLWYILEKYKEDANGDLQLAYTYFLFDGQIVYYNINDKNNRCGSDVFGGDLLLPVPFKAGDMITCDGGHTGIEHQALILSTGDNKDCCSLVGFIKRKDDILDCAPIKHSTIFYNFRSAVYVPPLFSAKLMSDELLEEEVVLKEISAWIDGDENRGKVIADQVYYVQQDEITKEWFDEMENAYIKKVTK